MGSESTKTQPQNLIRASKKPPPPKSTSTAASRRRPMRSAACIIEWLKPNCLKPDKPKNTRPKSPYKSSGQSRAAAAAAGGGGNFVSLEEHLSTSSPLIDSGQPVSSRFPHPGSRKPSPKRIHPSSAAGRDGGGRRQRKGKGKSKSFTLETLVKLDRESKEDYDLGRSNLVSRDDDNDGGGGSSRGPAGSRSCSRPEVMKKAKSVRFTLPGDGDVFVFYSPKNATDRPFHSL